jgi:hypothetical protein
MKRRPAPSPPGVRIEGPYRGPTGVWRYNITRDRDNVCRWGSLRTKDQTEALRKLADITGMLKRAEEQ